MEVLRPLPAVGVSRGLPLGNAFPAPLLPPEQARGNPTRGVCVSASFPDDRPGGSRKEPESGKTTMARLRAPWAEENGPGCANGGGPPW